MADFKPKEYDVIYHAENELIPETEAAMKDEQLKLQRNLRSKDYFRHAITLSENNPELALDLLKVLDRSGHLQMFPFTGEKTMVDNLKHLKGFTDLARKHKKLIY